MHRHGWVCALAALIGCKFPELPPLESDDGGTDAESIDADLQLPQPLTVTVDGPGIVTSQPGGISCGATCAASFDPLSSVMLTATADATAVFEGWSGDCSGSTSCAVTMDGAKQVSASFRSHGAVRWAIRVGSSGDDYIDDVALDAQGNVVVAGTLGEADGSDLFAAKYRLQDGQLIWMKRLDTPNPAYETFGGLAVDSEGNVYLAARLQGDGSAVAYGGASAVGDVFGNILVLRLDDATGDVVWARQWGGSSQDIPTAIAVSGADVYVAGTTSSSTATFDALTLPSMTGHGFVVRASAASGAAQTVKSIPASVKIGDLAVNGVHVAVVGATAGAFNLGAGCAVTPTGSGTDGLVVDLISPGLDCQWARVFGDTTSGNEAAVASVAAFPGGGWALTGSFEGNLLGLVPSAPGSRGQYDIFTVRFSAAGDPAWVYRYGDTASEFGNGIDVTPGGNVVLTGSFNGTLVLGATSVTGTSNSFVTRMSAEAAPTHEWAVSLGGGEADDGRDVVVDGDGSVYALASFRGMTDVGGTALSSLGGDSWLAALVR